MSGFKPYDPNSSVGGDGIPEAPQDGQPYSRQDAGWVVSPGGGSLSFNFERVTTQRTLTNTDPSGKEYFLEDAAGPVPLILPDPATLSDGWFINVDSLSFSGNIFTIEDHLGATFQQVESTARYRIFKDGSGLAIETLYVPIINLVLDEVTYGDFNATAWGDLQDGFYVMFALGSEIFNQPAEITLNPASNYFIQIEIRNTTVYDNIPPELNFYSESVAMSTDSDWTNNNRSFARSGSGFSIAVTTGWVVNATLGDTAVFAAQSGMPVYQWKTDVTATDPLQGFIKGNNADLSLITELYVNDLLDTGADLGFATNKFYTGDVIFISEFSSSSNYMTLEVTGSAVDNTGWHTIPVTVQQTNGALINIDKVSLTTLSTSTRAPALNIERILDGRSLATNQQPTGTGEANQIQVEYGPAVNTISDPVNLLADGSLVFNESGLYRLKVSLSYGRTGGGGVSELRFRALINGVQAGQTIGTEIDNDNVLIPFSDETWLNIPAPGVVITYEIMRDSSGSNSGGIFQPVISSATAPSWNIASCAAIRVERFR